MNLRTNRFRRPPAASGLDPRRRDLLAWLVAAPAVSACASRADGEAPSSPIAGHDEDQDDVATFAADWHACRSTTRDAEGPYFTPGSPVRAASLVGPAEPGVPFVLEGRLLGPDCRTPLVGYALDVWQADASGAYHDAASSGFRLRGKVVTDGLGRYKVETVLPGRYTDAGGTRPAHLHVKVLTPLGLSLLTTQLYFAGDPFLGANDYCTRARTCNSSDPARVLTLAEVTLEGRLGVRAAFDARLART